jgi:DNA-binding NtrC family response regulator
MSEPRRILIVDDEPVVRLVFRTALESAGPSYRVETAAGGDDALRQLEAGPFDLLLLDLNMPALGGLEVLRRLRERGIDVPVVIVTAYGSVPDAVEAMKLGAIDFLAKPLTPEALRDAVAGVIDRYSPRPSASDFARYLAGAKRELNARRFREAEALLKEAVALDPKSAEALNLTGVLHELLGDHQASYRAYRAALKADRHYEPATNNLTRYIRALQLRPQRRAARPGRPRRARSISRTRK